MATLLAAWFTAEGFGIACGCGYPDPRQRQPRG